MAANGAGPIPPELDDPNTRQWAAHGCHLSKFTAQ